MIYKGDNKRRKKLKKIVKRILATSLLGLGLLFGKARLSYSQSLLSDPEEIVVEMYKSSICDVEEEENPISTPTDIKTKTKKGRNSIFVEAFQTIQMFPSRGRLNGYDPI